MNVRSLLGRLDPIDQASIERAASDPVFDDLLAYVRDGGTDAGVHPGAARQPPSLVGLRACVRWRWRPRRWSPF